VTNSRLFPHMALFLINDKNAYQAQLLKDAVEAAKARDFAFDPAKDVHLCGGDPSLQRTQILRALNCSTAERYDVIVVSSAGNGSFMNSFALQEITGVVSLNHRIRDIGRIRSNYAKAHPNDPRPFAVVSPDNEEAGRLQADQVKAILPGGGVVLYIQGPAISTPADDRLNGFKTRLGSDSRYRVSYREGDWMPFGAQQHVTKWLASGCPPPDIIACQNDEMALGAHTALEEARRAGATIGRIPIVGLDGMQLGQDLLRKGQIAATIVMPSCTRQAVELIHRTFEGESLGDIFLGVSSYPLVRDLRPASVAA
jgi:ABC-type sugar transport system substrate-binding protein